MLLRCGPGLGSEFGKRMEEVQSIEEADQRSLQILGFGVRGAGHSHGQGEQKVVGRCAAADICEGQDSRFP